MFIGSLVSLLLIGTPVRNLTSIQDLIRVSPTESETVRYIVYLDSIMHLANVKALGVAVQRTAFGQIGPFNNNFEYILPKKIEKRIRSLKIPMTKIFGWHGGKINGNDTLAVLKKELDSANEICRRLNIPEEWTILELERQFGRNASLNPVLYDSVVSYSARRGYGFRIWRIKNEIYRNWSPVEYSTHLKGVVPAIRKNQPNSMIAIAIPEKNRKWTQKIIELTQGKYDILMPHLYANLPTWEYKFEDIIAAQNFKIFSKIIELKSLIAGYQGKGGKRVLIIDGEWGLNSPGKNGEKPLFNPLNGNILGVIHRAYRLVYYIRENLVDGAIAWNLLNVIKRRGKPSQGFSLLFTDAPNKTSLLYWLYYLFRRHIGKYVVKVRGSVPFFTSKKLRVGNISKFPITAGLATYTPDSSVLFLVITNSSYSDTLTGHISIMGNPGINKVNGISLSDFRSHPLDSLPVIQDTTKVLKSLPVRLARDANFYIEILPHSVTFLRIELENLN